MMSRIGLVVASLLWVASLPAQSPAPLATYAAAEAGAHIREIARVTGKVEKVHRSKRGNVFLNLDGVYPHEAFTVFIRAADAEKFGDLERFQGRTVTVTGKIDAYNLRPEIVATTPDQLTTQPAD